MRKRKNEQDFETKLKARDKVYVLFYATWCPFSKEFLPVFEEYERSNPKECLKVIVDGRPDLCEKYSVEYYPTVILFEKGDVKKRLDAKPHVGLSKKQLEKMVKPSKFGLFR